VSDNTCGLRQKTARVVFRLLRTIVYVVTNPNRSLARKVLDSVFLVALPFLVLTVLLNPSPDDVAYYFMLVPVVVLITCRSWYSMPRIPRPRVRPTEDRPMSAGVLSTTDGDAPTHGWDPMSMDQATNHLSEHPALPHARCSEAIGPSLGPSDLDPGPPHIHGSMGEDHIGIQQRRTTTLPTSILLTSPSKFGGL
jgi:hypothetical protein